MNSQVPSTSTEEGKTVEEGNKHSISDDLTACDEGSERTGQCFCEMLYDFQTRPFCQHDV